MFLGFEQAFDVLHRVFRVNFCGGWKGSEICFTGVQGRDLIIADLSFRAFRVQMAGGFWFASKGLEVCVLALFFWWRVPGVGLASETKNAHTPQVKVLC